MLARWWTRQRNVSDSECVGERTPGTKPCENCNVSKKRSGKQDNLTTKTGALTHVLVVGGTTHQWLGMSASAWAQRRDDLAKTAAHAGASWLTIRPYEGDVAGNGGVYAASDPTAERRVFESDDGCTVIVDPCADGRTRFLAAVDQLRVSAVSPVDDVALAAALMAPAPTEPDLTVILGPTTKLPLSLVWELSYTELVFIDTSWDELSGSQLEHAIGEYAHRHRRFGGIA